MGSPKNVGEIDRVDAFYNRSFVRGRSCPVCSNLDARRSKESQDEYLLLKVWQMSGSHNEQPRTVPGGEQ